MRTKEEEIVDSLRKLVGAIFIECKGAYGAGDEGYQGEFEEEIQKFIKLIIDKDEIDQKKHP